MLTKYDHFGAGVRAENIVRKPTKRFTKRVEVSPNAKILLLKNRLERFWRALKKLTIRN